MALAGRKIDDLYRRGVITDSEAAFQAIVAAGEMGANNIVSELSKELISLVLEELSKAPRTEKEWEGHRWIFAGTFGAGFDYEAKVREMNERYRTGINILRDHFSSLHDAG